MTSSLDHVAFINGAIQTIIGHPLDTLKTWKQSNVKKLINFKNLYKGVCYPLLTNSIICHVQFNIMDYKFSHYSLNYLLTALYSGLFLTPIEYYKIRRQNNLKLNFPKGFGITLMREIPGCFIYFGILRNFKSFTNINSDFLAGGTAGLVSWLITYPIDSIKTKIQSDMSFKQAIKKPLFKGLNYCLARAFIANSIGYYCYVNLNKIL